MTDPIAPPAAPGPTGSGGLFRLALVLGLVSLSGPLGLNMYVPAFPDIAADLGSDGAGIQLSLTSFLIALAFGQNVYGPLADRFGRRPPLFAGLALFVAASIAVALSPSIEFLVIARFVQGFGACAAMAIPRAVIRDLHTGARAARLMALVLLVVSIAPLVAPMIGSMLALLSWRYIFWSMAATGLAAILLVAILLPETLPPHQRSDGGLRQSLRGYGVLIRDRQFLGIVLLMALTQAAFFTYLGGSPQLFLGPWGWSSWNYSLLFVVTGVFWAGSAQLAPWAMERLGSMRLLIVGALFNALVMTALTLLTLAGAGGPVPLIGAVILLFSCSGILLPAATVAALHHHGELAGTASALLGTAGFAAGAIGSALVGAFADNSDRPLVLGMTLATIGALAAARVAFGGKRAAVR